MLVAAPYGALVLVAGMVSLVFLIVWVAFERSRHILLWSGAFALAATMWALELVIGPAGVDQPTYLAARALLEGLAAAAIAIGFRRRSGRAAGAGLMIAGAAGQAAACGALAMLGIAWSQARLPLVLFDAAMFLLAARSLTGRRQGEQAAERIAAGALAGLATFNILSFAASIADAFGATVDVAGVDRAWLLLLPPVVAGIGLFTIFLIAADLADRTRRLAAIDMQTGLLNRRGLEEAIGAIIASVRRNRRSMALALVDIDRFKTINDRFGHAAGDRLIEAFGQCLRDSTSRRDLVARIGGEEFAIVMTDVDAGAAMCAAEVLRERVATIEVDFTKQLDVTASFGLTEFRADDEGLTTLFSRADKALYSSKAAGRNRATLAT